MSIRPKEAFEASQTFSLREALSAGAAPSASAAAGGLRFDLASINSSGAKPSSPETLPQACKPVQAPAGMSLRFAAAPVQAAAPPKQGFVLQQPAALPNLSFNSVAHSAGRQIIGAQAAAAQAKEVANTKADVMRLSAYVDELTKRLRKTQNKLEQTEAQLTRTSQVLCHERQAADQMLGGYKKDLAIAHETEEKLRTEIAGTKKKATVQDSAFMASVGSALASDEQIRMQQRNLQELETKVNAMGDFKVKLEAEVAKIEGLRKVADKELAELKLAHEQQAVQAKAASAELATAQRALSDVKVSHDDMAERLAAAKVEEATLSEAVDALRTAKLEAEQQAGVAKEQTQAALVEHSEAARSLADVKRRVAALRVQEEEATQAAAAAAALAETAAAAAVALPPEPVAIEDHADDVSEFELEPSASQASQPRRMVVTGAQAPDRQLCAGVADTATAHRAHLGFGGGVAAMLETDAPIGLTLERISFVGAQHCLLMDSGDTGAGPRQKAEDPTAKMVNAVVGDLKQKLQEISMRQPVWRQVAPLA